MKTLYRLVMDSDLNPLRDLPAVQRFQVMLYLSIMWTTIFCAIAGTWVLYSELMVAHVLIAVGFLVTGLAFHQAKRAASYRDQPLHDGTARYDDVWGA